MREFKATILAAVALAFVAGTGAGAWIGSLRAAPTPTSSRISVDRRLETWTERYNLTPSEQRRMRSVLLRYDSRRDRIYSELSSEQWRQLNQLREDSRREIDQILKERTAPDSPAGG